MVNHKKYLEKEVTKEIKKLKFSNFSKFWKNIAGDVKSTKNTEFDISQYDAPGTKTNISSAAKDTINSCLPNLMFSLNEATDALIFSFKVIKSNIIDVNLTEILSKAKNETRKTVTDNLQKIDSKFFSPDIATKAGEDLGKAITSYIISNKLTFKQAVQKINKALDAIGSLRLKELIGKNKSEEKISKENSLAIFKNIIGSKDKESRKDIETFLTDIDEKPEIFEYVLKNLPPDYSMKPSSNAMYVRNHTITNQKDYSTVSTIYVKYVMKLKKEFDQQIQKLDCSKLTTFWKTFLKDATSANLSLSELKIKNNLSTVVKSVWNKYNLNLDDCVAKLLNSFIVTKRNIINLNLNNTLKNADVDMTTINENLQKIDSNFLSVELAQKSGTELEEAVVDYAKSNKLTLKQTIQKLNKLLATVGNLRLKDLLKK